MLYLDVDSDKKSADDVQFAAVLPRGVLVSTDKGFLSTLKDAHCPIFANDKPDTNLILL